MTSIIRIYVFKIFGSQGRAERRKRNFTSLEVPAERTYPGRTSAEDERDLPSPGRGEVWTAELQTFGSKDRAELRKQSFRPLKVLAERMCES